MKIESLDFFYLAMPRVLDIGDGSQDALLVRARATGGHEGWGECEASPLVSIAALVCPMSHSACKPVQDSVLGQTLETPDDIRRIGDLVRRNSFDLLQADHTLSGIDVALWDLLARRRGEPVYKLLGYKRQARKVAYASQLFQDTPQRTFDAAKKVAAAGFRAAKFGWGPYGQGSVEADAEQVRAAFEGLGPDRMLLVDAGTVWATDVAAAAERLPVLRECRVGWLEEPFVSGALDAYRRLSALAAKFNVPLAAGEGAHNVHQARHLIDYGNVDFIQIDAGRIGGLTAAKDVADYVVAGNNRVKYVNHTFTSHLALSASIQPYAGLSGSFICEYPADPKSLAWELTTEHLTPDSTGHIEVPEAPGLGLLPDPEAIRKYLVETEIVVKGKALYRTPKL